MNKKRIHTYIIDINRLTALLGHFAEPREREVRLCARLSVEPRELVEVVAQQFAHDEEVLLVVKVVVPKDETAGGVTHTHTYIYIYIYIYTYIYICMYIYIYMYINK